MCNLGGMTPEKLFHDLPGLDLNGEMTESRFESKSGIVFGNPRDGAAPEGVLYDGKKRNLPQLVG